MRKLIVSDVEGVILPRKIILLFRISKIIGFYTFVKNIIRGILYELGFLSLQDLIKNFYRDLKGLPLNRLWEIYLEDEVMKRLESLRKLKENGFDILLVSSGVPQQFMDKIKEKGTCDEAYGVKVRVDTENRIIDVVENEVLRDGGKVRLVENFCRLRNVRYDEIIVVADDWNNLQLREIADIFIGFNPDNRVAAKAAMIIQDDKLDSLINFLLSSSKPKLKEKYILRKMAHISGILLLLMPNSLAIGLLLLAILLYSIEEILRIYDINFPILSQLVRFLGKGNEISGPALTPIWYAIGLILSLLTPYPYIGIVSLTLLDSTSGITNFLVKGHAYPFNQNKKIEGNIAGIIVTTLALSYTTNIVPALLVSLAAALAETFSYMVDDDITIPISATVSYHFIKNWFC
ncbi:MAG: hypothetical protein DRJ64_03780 [Thermoprotei archaeon]|nr:MAG: hypothetical protein DRJ64_03780 [Thermoprotei archaeon]